jgi:class 3 adenylate cyclase
MRPETRYVGVGDASIAYQILGPDEPASDTIDLIYMTGATTHVDMRWDVPSLAAFMERLAEFARVIVFDRRGSGASDPLPPEEDVRWEAWAEDLRTVLDAANSRQAAVMGAIDGGPAALMFAATYPERTRALILSNTSARLLAAEDYPEGMSCEVMEGFIALAADAWGSERFVGAVSPTVPKAEWPAMARLQRASMSPRAAAERMRVEQHTDIRRVLPTIRVPTLVLHSTDFVVLGVEHSRYLARNIPGAELVEISGPSAAMTVGVDAIERFLTGSTRIVPPDRMLATVVFTDIVGSTTRAAALGDREWRALLERHDGLTRSTVESFGGRVWKSTGDGVMASFDAPGRAIRCLRVLRQALAELGLDIRAGVHAGEVEVRDADLSGLSVHTAARVMEAAGDGGFVVSRTIADLVAGSDITLEDLGERSLKGVPGEWRLFRVAD